MYQHFFVKVYLAYFQNLVEILMWIIKNTNFYVMWMKRNSLSQMTSFRKLQNGQNNFTKRCFDKSLFRWRENIKDEMIKHWKVGVTNLYEMLARWKLLWKDIITYIANYRQWCTLLNESQTNKGQIFLWMNWFFIIISNVMRHVANMRTLQFPLEATH